MCEYSERGVATITLEGVRGDDAGIWALLSRVRREEPRHPSPELRRRQRHRRVRLQQHVHQYPARMR